MTSSSNQDQAAASARTASTSVSPRQPPFPLPDVPGIDWDAMPAYQMAARTFLTRPALYHGKISTFKVVTYLVMDLGFGFSTTTAEDRRCLNYAASRLHDLFTYCGIWQIPIKAGYWNNLPYQLPKTHAVAYIKSNDPWFNDEKGDFLPPELWPVTELADSIALHRLSAEQVEEMNLARLSKPAESNPQPDAKS